MINKILSSPRYAPLAMAVISASALGVALISQYWGGLGPCFLCVYQRWPYGIVIALGLIGFLSSFKCIKGVVATMTLIGMALMEDVLADIQSRTKAVRCDEIAWSDPIGGVSMANYNIVFCLVLAVLAFMSVRQVLKAD